MTAKPISVVGPPLDLDPLHIKKSIVMLLVSQGCRVTTLIFELLGIGSLISPQCHSEAPKVPNISGSPVRLQTGRGRPLESSYLC